MQKIIVLTTDGGDSEDGNVYYASYLLVSNGGDAGLKFDEPVFSNDFGGSRDQAIKAFETLGYRVEVPETLIIITDLYDSGDYDDYDDEDEEDEE